MISTYTKIPVVYNLCIEPDASKFYITFLNSVNFSEINQSTFLGIKIIDKKIKYLQERSEIEISMLIELHSNSMSSINQYVDIFLAGLDSYFKTMSDNFKNSFTFEKRVYL